MSKNKKMWTCAFEQLDFSKFVFLELILTHISFCFFIVNLHCKLSFIILHHVFALKNAFSAKPHQFMSRLQKKKKYLVWNYLWLFGIGNGTNISIRIIYVLFFFFFIWVLTNSSSCKVLKRSFSNVKLCLWKASFHLISFKLFVK